MKAYFSCGAGDFIAMESFFSEEEKGMISEFVLATRGAETIKQLISFHPIWKDKPVHILFKEKEILSYKVYAFYDIAHLEKITRKKYPVLSGAWDCSGEVIYNQQILKGTRKFKGSGFEFEPLECDVVFDPESNNDDRLVKKGRNFTDQEKAEVYSNFKGLNIKEVGLGKTSLLEAFQYVSGAKHFIGVDSMLACYACRTEKESINIKTVNHIYEKWLPIYDPLNKVILKKVGF